MMSGSSSSLCPQAVRSRDVGKVDAECMSHLWGVGVGDALRNVISCNLGITLICSSDMHAPVL